MGKLSIWIDSVGSQLILNVSDLRTFIGKVNYQLRYTYDGIMTTRT